MESAERAKAARDYANAVGDEVSGLDKAIVRQQKLNRLREGKTERRRRRKGKVFGVAFGTGRQTGLAAGRDFVERVMTGPTFGADFRIPQSARPGQDDQGRPGLPEGWSYIDEDELAWEKRKLDEELGGHGAEATAEAAGQVADNAKAAAKAAEELAENIKEGVKPTEDVATGLNDASTSFGDLSGALSTNADSVGTLVTNIGTFADSHTSALTSLNDRIDRLIQQLQDSGTVAGGVS